MKRFDIRQTILLAIALTAGAGWSFTASAADVKSTKAERNLIVEGNKAFADSNFIAAFDFYEKALTANPLSDAATYNKAVTLTYLVSEDNKNTPNDPRVKAVELFETLTRTAADKTIAEKSFYNLGNMAFRDGDYGKAIENYKGALRINPDNNKTRQNLRIAQLQQQQQQNQDQNQDQDQDQQQEQQQQQQQQEQNEDQQQEQQQQQQQQQPEMTQNAEQILQSVQNKENQTRKKVNEQQVNTGRKTTDKPW